MEIIEAKNLDPNKEDNDTCKEVNKNVEVQAEIPESETKQVSEDVKTQIDDPEMETQETKELNEESNLVALEEKIADLQTLLLAEEGENDQMKKYIDLLEKQNQLILQQRDDLQAIVDKTPVRK
jgi:hypothetical protein